MKRVASPEPPYLRIAADLRRQISQGALRPGDKVPSTRELAKQWGVALATAAHALTALSQEGVLRAQPRSGTVVAGPAGRSGTPRGPAREGELNLDRILTAAIALADEQGLSGFSLRGVAGQLGVPVMSLYRHVRSKQELVLRMTDAALAEEIKVLDAPPPTGWRAQLELAARAEWRVLRQHPWLARTMNLTRPSAQPNGLKFAEWILRALEGHGLDGATMMRIHISLHSFVQGIAVNLETEADTASETGMSDEDWMRSQEAQFAAAAASGRYPTFAKILSELASGFELDFDQLFDLGLRALLDGYAPLIKKGGRYG